MVRRSHPATHLPRRPSRSRRPAASVALCWACHTDRNENTGELSGPRFGGTSNFKEPGDPGHIWAPPNITSDPTTGKLGTFSEDDFVIRFRAGRVLPGSPMPWQGFRRMSEEDIRAIYRYLETVPPVKRDVGPPVRDVSQKVSASSP
jgi:hypothetical protein